MGDQAERLRNLMAKNSKQEKHNARVISVTSGKGGVGKTNFSINFAISLKKLGYKVIVFDADIGLANAEIISGTIIKHTIADLLQDEDKDIFDIINEGPKGIKLISGGSGLKELSLINENSLIQILKQLEILEEHFDFIIIDTGAGLSDIVLDFIMASHEVIFVITSDPTSLTDGYTLLKALVKSGYKGEIKILMNMVENKAEALEVYNKLNTVAKKFLRINIEYLGYLKRNNVVKNAVKNQIPFVISNPNSQLSRRINIIALNYINEDKVENTNEKFSFTKKLKGLIMQRWFF